VLRRRDLRSAACPSLMLTLASKGFPVTKLSKPGPKASRRERSETFAEKSAGPMELAGLSWASHQGSKRRQSHHRHHKLALLIVIGCSTQPPSVGVQKN
jgi:hypothetical protein